MMLMIACPRELSAAARRCVHAACDDCGVPHVSRGEGADRRVLVQRPGAGGGNGGAAAAEGRADATEDAGAKALVLDDANPSWAPEGARWSMAARVCVALGHELGERFEERLRALIVDAYAEERRRESGAGAQGPAHRGAAGASSAMRLEDDALGVCSVLGGDEFDDDLTKWIARTSGLLDTEKEAEEKEQEENGRPRRTAPKLVCVEASTGLLGRTVLKFASASASSPAEPSHADSRYTPLSSLLSSHDIVAIRSNKAAAGSAAIAKGVVYRCGDDSISVAVDAEAQGVNDEGGIEQIAANGVATYRLDKLANDVTHLRLKQTLARLEGACVGEPAEKIVRLAFACTPSTGLAAAAAADASRYAEKPEFCSAPMVVGNTSTGTLSSPPPGRSEAGTMRELAFLNGRLDESQKAAVRLAVRAQDLALVHGPPGTGKTTALIEAIAQMVLRGGRRVLCCAASNVAVDNIVERLVAADRKLARKIVRLGHPARMLPSVLACSVEALVNQSDAKGLARDCKRERDKLSAQLQKCSGRAERRAIHSEMRKLSKEARQWETDALNKVMDKADIILCTLTVAADYKRLKQTATRRPFDVTVIDEAAQALEVASWSAIVHAPCVVMAGDHHQLPPTVVSEDAAARGLSDTLFKRLIDMYGPSASVMLDVQYRMHTKIMEWSSERFYGGRLKAHASVADGTLSETGVAFREAPHAVAPAGAGALRLTEVCAALQSMEDSPLVFVDTAGCCMGESIDEETLSRYNESESELVLAIVHKLIVDGVPPGDIGVISPYAAQVAQIRRGRDVRLPQSSGDGRHGEGSRAAAAVEVSTVDGFQGREKEVIVISCVRSNDAGEVGFLSDYRRMNVAVTRAKRMCVLIGDSETMRRDDMLSSLVTQFEENGEYISAQQIIE